MAEHSTSITINALPEEIWEVLGDFAAISTWVPMIQHSCSLSGQTSGVGATRRVQIAQQALVETVTIWEPNASLAYTIDGMPPIVGTARNTWTLQPQANGTLVNLTTEIPTAWNPIQRLAASKALERMSIAARFMTTGLRQEVARRKKEVRQ
ncbi:MAG: SRPBCC family protein [Ilumatobacteraceae bacterium]|nr:SRPBCC family protein [Actinomycetota bacterium]